MIHENLKAARKAKGMSQEELAVRLNVVRQTVSKWERGLSVPDADVLIQIAALLEVPVQELLGTGLPKGTAEELAQELARLNEQLARKNQQEALRQQAEKKRGLILFLSFVAMVAALRGGNRLLPVLFSGGCWLAALVVLYRNLALLTSVTAPGAKTGALKLTTGFNLAILILTVAVAALQARGPGLPQQGERLLACGLVSAVMLFGGFVSPRLPFNRHTGLRLPWTVQDEETWHVAHQIIGTISFPLVLLYLTAAFTVRNFEAVCVAAILLWVGIPAALSLAFWWKKMHGKP